MVDIDPTQDYYAVLGLDVGASPEAIRQVYRELAKRYHPDTGHGDVERFRCVQEAYQILYDASYRKAYDRQRASRGQGASQLEIEIVQSRRVLAALDIPQMLYLLVDIRPQAGLGGVRKRLNLGVVIDCSTSMQGARVQSVKAAARDLLDALKPEDRLVLVAFSDRAEVLAAAQLRGNEGHFRSAISSMTASGGTEIYRGLAAAIRQVRTYATPEVLSHILLLTDGRTYGDEEAALRAAVKAQTSGIGLSAFGIGEDWNDLFLDRLARCGGGSSQYVDSPAKVQRVLRSQIRGLTRTALVNAKVKVSLASCADLVGAYRVAPCMDVLTAEEGDCFSLGSLMRGESTVLVMELALQSDEMGRHRVARVAVEGENAADLQPLRFWRDLDVSVRPEAENEIVPPRLLTILARLSIFRLQEHAWRALESGNPEQATRYLTSAATHLFDLGYRDLGQVAMLEVSRITQEGRATNRGRKQLRYGTRTLSGSVP